MTVSAHWKIKLSISSYFITIGFIIGNWVARIPSVKEEHHLSDGLFGVILVTGIFGCLLCLPVISPIINRFGSNVGTLSGAIATALLVPIIGVTRFGLALLIVGIMGLGFGMGMVDVSMNAQAAAFEMLSGSHCLGLFHANYAVGGFLGALVGGILAQQDVSPIKNFLLVSICCFPFNIILYFWLLNKTDEARILKQFQSKSSEVTGDEKSREINETETVSEALLIKEDALILGVQHDPATHDQPDPANASCCRPTHSALQLRLMFAIAFIASLGEGSINDWSTIYFVETLGSSQLMAAIGYAAFELTLATGRLYSDYLLARYAGRELLLVASLTAAAGIGLIVLSPSLLHFNIEIAVVGFAVCGAGVSICSPLVTHLASRVAGCNPTDSIAQVTTGVYLALMMGPPLMGGLSAAFGGLRWAYIVIGALLASIFIFASAMHKTSHKSTENHSPVFSPLATADEAAAP